MRIEDVNPSIIGRRVSCIENGTRVPGTITGISEDNYAVLVKIRFDKPLHCWSGDYNIEEWYEDEYDSWARKCDGWGNLQYTYFIDTLDWLADYRPKDDQFTDQFEVKVIEDNLGISNMSNEDLQAARDKVVVFYSKLIKKAIDEGDHDRRWALSNAMQSVTAVIDHNKFNRGMEV